MLGGDTAIDKLVEYIITHPNKTLDKDDGSKTKEYEFNSELKGLSKKIL